MLCCNIGFTICSNWCLTKNIKNRDFFPVYIGWNLTLTLILNKHDNTVTAKILQGNLVESDSIK